MALSPCIYTGRSCRVQRIRHPPRRGRIPSSSATRPSSGPSGRSWRTWASSAREPSSHASCGVGNPRVPAPPSLPGVTAPTSNGPPRWQERRSTSGSSPLRSPPIARERPSGVASGPCFDEWRVFRGGRSDGRLDHESRLGGRNPTLDLRKVGHRADRGTIWYRAQPRRNRIRPQQAGTEHSFRTEGPRDKRSRG